jgi:iron(II)-dependent oxidoreductase
MSIDSTTNSTATARRGWAARLFGGLRPAPHLAVPARDRRRADGIGAMARRLIDDDRYAFLLLKEAAADVGDDEARPALRALRQRMALVPGGVVPVVRADGHVEPVAVAAFYLDRNAVTNRQYQRFVADGGYDDLETWPREVWPSVLKLVDRTGRPGPRDWRRGEYPPDLADHPVVGVCWYEATAYARWAGKRLPTAGEWQKAAGWPEQLGGGGCTRFPWGDVFDPVRANLHASGRGGTAPVDAFPAGATPNGLYQLAGNVWEWLADPLEIIPCAPGESLRPLKPLRRVVGGAFDTHFVHEATNQFITGQGELDRRHNVGFRCAVAADRLRDDPTEVAP